MMIFYLNDPVKMRVTKGFRMIHKVKDLRCTTKSPKRIHMEAMREPKASMKPMKSQMRAPANKEKAGCVVM